MNKWFETVLNTLSDVIGKFIGHFKKNGFVFSLGCALVFVITYTLIINPIRMDKIIEKRFETEKERLIEETELSMQKRLMADEMIGNIMTKMVDKFSEVHRVMLLEGHNSIQNRNGIHFSYFSCTAEMLTPNSRHYNYLSEDLQRQQRNTLIGINMINTLKHRQYIYYNDISDCQHPEHRLIHKIADNSEDNEVIIYPFLNKSGEPIILIVVSGNDLPSENIVEYINEYKKQIEECLM